MNSKKNSDTSVSIFCTCNCLCRSPFIDLDKGFKENYDSASPSFNYILKDVITLKEDI